MPRKLWLPLAVAILATPAAATTPAAPDIAGHYRTPRTGMVVTIASCSGGGLCGRILALGTLPPTDANNPAPPLQDRPLCRMVVLDGLEWRAGSWHGTLYEPQNGTSYTITLAAAENGAVRVTGHSGRPVLSRVPMRPFEVWERLPAPPVPCDGAPVTS